MPGSAARGAAAAAGSVLGYQCGGGVCLIDPDVPGAQPRQVAPEGRFAGVTADGKTLAWVPPSGGLVTAPTAGGPPTTVYTGTVGTQPLISPDGSHFMWQSPVVVVSFLYNYRLDVATGEVYGISACQCVVSHGWAGPTSIGAFPIDGTRPSRLCRMERGSGSSCVAVLASETRGQLAFPDASADGQTLVASVDVGGSEYGGATGPLALYSAATGALVKDLTTGAEDATPTLSQEGDRVAFERGGQIVIVDIATGVERVIGPGFYPSWGGTRTEQGGGGGGEGTGSGTAAVKGRKLTAKAGKVKVKIACTGATACQGQASLSQRKKVLAKKSYTVAAGQSDAVRLKLTKAGRKRFKGNGKAKLVLTLRSTGATGGGTDKTKVKVRY